MQGVKSHAHWSSRLTFLFAAVGAAVGLGNIWRFPYLAGESGGGAFVLVYVGCVVLVVIPIVIAELAMGRRGGQSAVKSMAILAERENRSPKWAALGWLGVLTGFLILTFYSVIAGWCLAYIFTAAGGGLEGITAAQSNEAFEALLGDPWRVGLWHAAFMALTVLIVARGLHGGLEKAVNWLMPALFILLIVLVGYAAVAGDFWAGWHFLFDVDFSKITANTVLLAIGQAFFSVGVSMGIMFTYGAYLPRHVIIPRAAVIIAAADTAVALLAGLAIFPLVFAYGLAPGQGPGLIFKTLPIAFGQMPGGTIFGLLFFLLLAFAALTSSISILEPMVAWLEEQSDVPRAKLAVGAGGVAFVIGLGSVFSSNIWADFTPLEMFAMFEGKTFMDLTDYVTGNIMLPVGGLLIAVFAGWKMARASTVEELGIGDGGWYRAWRLMIRYLVPVALAAVFLSLIGALDWI